MKMPAAVLAVLLVPAFLLAGAIAQPAMAQGKATVKQITSDDKASAYEVTYKPGDERAIAPGHRVVRALKGGSLERTHADGKKEKVEYKTGQVRINKPTQGYTTKNVGKSEVQLYVVEQK
jgi:hypothetical protein